MAAVKRLPVQLLTTSSSRQYDPEPSPNVTDYPAPNTFVPAWNGSSIDTFLEPFGKYDLLAYMRK